MKNEIPIWLRFRIFCSLPADLLRRSNAERFMDCIANRCNTCNQRNHSLQVLEESSEMVKQNKSCGATGFARWQAT